MDAIVSISLLSITAVMGEEGEGALDQFCQASFEKEASLIMEEASSSEPV